MGADHAALIAVITIECRSGRGRCCPKVCDATFIKAPDFGTEPRELQDLGGSPAACSSALGGGELVALQAAPQPYVGDGSGVFACRCRFGEPEFIRRIAADPGTLDAQLTIASSVTREYVDWPEKRARQEDDLREVSRGGPQRS